MGKQIDYASLQYMRRIDFSGAYHIIDPITKRGFCSVSNVNSSAPADLRMARFRLFVKVNTIPPIEEICMCCQRSYLKQRRREKLHMLMEQNNGIFAADQSGHLHIIDCPGMRSLCEYAWGKRLDPQYDRSKEHSICYACEKAYLEKYDKQGDTMNVEVKINDVMYIRKDMYVEATHKIKQLTDHIMKLEATIDIQQKRSEALEGEVIRVCEVCHTQRYPGEELHLGLSNEHNTLLPPTTQFKPGMLLRVVVEKP